MATLAVVTHPVHADPVPDPRYTSERYFALVSQGVLAEDDRVELLEGVIVAMSPQNPPHAFGVTCAYQALNGATGTRALLRIQLPLILGTYSVPEPDVAIVPGRSVDYRDRHPTTALLVVEVADATLVQDRLTKAAIYAAARIPGYWIVNLRDEQVEVHRDPDARRYATRSIARRGDQLALLGLPDASVPVADLLPGRD